MVTAYYNSVDCIVLPRMLVRTIGLDMSHTSFQLSLTKVKTFIIVATTYRSNYNSYYNHMHMRSPNSLYVTAYTVIVLVIIQFEMHTPGEEEVVYLQASIASQYRGPDPENLKNSMFGVVLSKIIISYVYTSGY